MSRCLDLVSSKLASPFISRIYSSETAEAKTSSLDCSSKFLIIPTYLISHHITFSPKLPLTLLFTAHPTHQKDKSFVNIHLLHIISTGHHDFPPPPHLPLARPPQNLEAKTKRHNHQYQASRPHHTHIKEDLGMGDRP